MKTANRATVTSNFSKESKSDTSGLNGDINKTREVTSKKQSNYKVYLPIPKTTNVSEFCNQVGDTFNGAMNKPLFTPPKEEVKQLAVLKKADQEMIDEGISEEDRSKIFEDSDLTDAIQISEALKKAQEEKIARMTREKKAVEKTSSQESKEPHGMEQSEIRDAIQNESFKLTPVEINKALENLSLVRMSRQDDGGVQFECHAIPPEERSTIAQKCLNALGRAYEGANDLADANPGAAKIIKESVLKGLEAIDFSGYVSSGLAGTTAGMAYGSTSLNPVGITIGGLVGMVGGMTAYHESKNVISTLFEAATDVAVDAAKAQGRTPEESQLYGESVATTLFVGSILTGKGKGGKVKKGELTQAANLNRPLSVLGGRKSHKETNFAGDLSYANQSRDFKVENLLAATNANRNNLGGLDLAKPRTGQGLLQNDFTKDVRAYVRDMESRSGIKMTYEQRIELANALRQNKFEKLDPSDKIKHGKEYVKARPQLISEWEKNTGNNWPTYSQDLINKSGKVIAKSGDDHQLHHVIPQQHGGDNKWWNVQPLTMLDHQGGVHKADGPLKKIIKESDNGK